MRWANLGALVAGALLLFFAATPSPAEERATYQRLLDQVTAAPDCTQQLDVDLLIVTCDKTYDIWYFTQPGHPAHPGVIRHYITQGPQGAGSAATRGWSFAQDAAQPAFKTFLAQIGALDEQARATLAARHGGAPVLAPDLHIYGNWQPQGSDSEAVVSLTNYYFRREDAGAYDEAYALIGPGLAATLPLAQYRALADQVVAAAGPVKSRTIKTIDWEKDSPQGPPGIFAALDYQAETARGQLCGYVVWQRAPDGFFVLVREETNIIPAALSDSEKAALKAKFHCVG